MYYGVWLHCLFGAAIFFLVSLLPLSVNSNKLFLDHMPEKWLSTGRRMESYCLFNSLICVKHWEFHIVFITVVFGYSYSFLEMKNHRRALMVANWWELTSSQNQSFRKCRFGVLFGWSFMTLLSVASVENIRYTIHSFSYCSFEAPTSQRAQRFCTDHRILCTSLLMVAFTSRDSFNAFHLLICGLLSLFKVFAFIS